MAWTQTDIDALKRAMASGARVLQLNGERVEYRTIAEMRAVLREMERELAGRAGGIAVSYPRLGRGL